ncbi:RNA polymerase sigma factor [Hallella colorans]|jgi:hypothetical protein|uniref:RNA polymerase sigma factor n=1 Tax=Hallella colorans TaxID=1703337 RepID=UPI0023F08F53|nr:sigma-70 family RNA polymerase sigma factor [Hallella colorans]
MTYTQTGKEEDIINLFREDNVLAMNKLYAEFAPYLTGICARYIAEDAELKDVLQESFIKIFTRIDHFEYRGQGSLRAWITRIVINESLQTLRQKKKLPLTSLDNEPVDLPDEEPATYGIDTETMAQLIGKLPAGYRTVLNLYIIEGLSHKEIAKMLGIKPDTSASQLHRSKNMLAKLILDFKRSKL